MAQEVPELGSVTEAEIDKLRSLDLVRVEEIDPRRLLADVLTEKIYQITGVAECDHLNRFLPSRHRPRAPPTSCAIR